MRCETFIELTIVILLAHIVAETASEPRWWSSRRRRHCHAQNCVLGHWSSWSSCSQSCGTAGQSKRTRAILRPASCGGAACSTRSEIKACNRFCLNGGTLMRSSCYCKAGYQGRCCEQVIGGWTSWGSWYHCSATCGRGTQYRKRSCTKPGGVGCVGNGFEYRSCFLRHCTTDGGWSHWSRWGHCTGSCGSGIQTRKRTCTNPPPGYGGAKCSGPAEQHKNCLLQRCRPVNGGWSAWKPWTACSKTCGEGLQFTHRYCNNPKPQFGGKPCVGPSSNTRTCFLESCAADGGWSPWGKWCQCSKTCGTGSQYRKRTCTRPPPGYGGKSCVGSDKQTRKCNTKPCPADGGWSPWGKWFKCSKTCGTGLQYRKRTCTRPPPGYGGKYCVGSDKQTRKCNTKPCRADGGWSPWGRWCKCSKTCGTGSQYRKRTCTRPPPGYGGKYCVGSDKQTRKCNTKPCLADGGWSPWGTWFKCSKTCGTGTQYRKRTCTRPPPGYGGKHCIGSDKQTRECNTDRCPVHGGWSNWTTWSACSRTCGNGKQISKRYCNNPPPKYGGRGCFGKSTRSRVCHIKPCSVNGRWSKWAVWSSCSKTCGSGTQIRVRSCTNPPPKYEGKCVGPNIQTKSCLVKRCPVNGRWSSWSAWTKCSKACGNGTKTRLRTCTNPPSMNGGKCVGPSKQMKPCLEKRCPVNGRWSNWAAWSNCSKTCGNGTKTRLRTCTNPPPKYGGKCGGPSKQMKPCLEKRCPVNGRWDIWSVWSTCSKTCGPGTLTRRRTCSNPPPKHGGKHCKGPSEQAKVCQLKLCAINGRWALWAVWSDCSQTCGAATKTRKRTCTNPPPQHGGNSCKGPSVQTKNCSLSTCPAYVAWGPWSHWITCSKTCGTGSQSRKRTCYGGIAGQGQCSGSDVETRNCNTQNCPVVNGGWGEWSLWSSCSESCGPGTAIRTRRCDSPPPGPGGKCIGLSFESQLCDEGPCPGNCWSDWSDWSQCTKACGCGRQFRVRFCNCAYGQGHAQCQGLAESSQSCNCQACPNGPPFDENKEG
ncbi:SCO-spondin-like isoform X2 [Acropora muricata]|uniref:SCO-spondin-like isoform X2 n=1 Tax=Acropora muricata TaxID=159855 RepID=UPI0034E3AEFE